MIIVRLSGGLGNQMFQYALGRRLASDRKVPLGLDLRWFEKHPERPYRLDAFQIQADILGSREVDRLTSGGKNFFIREWRKLQHFFPYYQRTIVKQEKIGFDANILNVPSTAYLDGYWQSELYFTPIENLIRQQFQLKDPRLVNMEIANEISNSNSVSIHVRRGDYATNQKINKSHGLCPKEYYFKAAEYMSNKLCNSRFFVFSDDILWAKENLSSIKSITFVSSDEMNDLQEFSLMRFCHNHIISNSTFGWWGAWLSDYGDKIVIAPQNWFGSPEIKYFDLVPRNWLRM